MRQSENLKYRKICTVYTTPDGESVRTYGIELTAGGQVAEFPDIDLSSAVVERLIDRLRTNAVEPCHFCDVVRDYIEERATP